MAERARRPRVAGHGRRPLDERSTDVLPVVTGPAARPVADVAAGEPEVLDPVAAEPEVHEPEVAEPDRAPGVTSPPLGSEPWAGVPPDAGDRPPARRGRRMDPWVAGLAVLTLVAVVLGGVDLVRRYALTDGTAGVNSAQSRAAVTAALNAAGPLTSYDYATTAATKIDAAKPLVTSGCAASYQKDLTTLAGTLDPLKVVETVSFSAGGVQSTGPGTVTVLVFGERTAKDSRSTTSQVSQLQVALTMVHRGGTWLVDGVVSNGSGGSGKPTC